MKIFQSLFFFALVASVFSQITIPLQSTHKTSLTSRMLDTSGADIALTNELNFQFVGPIQIGTPPQTFQVIFDTYYADTVVYSPNCESCDATFNTYNATASSTHFDDLKEVDFDFYGVNNPAQCEVYSDVISIAGYNLSDPEFLVIQNITNNSTKENQKYDGYFGMGFLTNLNYSTTPFSQLMNQQNLSKIFSFYYTNPAGQSGSSVTIGGYNTSLTLNITYHNISANNTWQLNLDDFGIGNKSLANNATGLQVILGSGIPAIAGDPQLMGSLLAGLEQLDYCSRTDNQPNIYFTIGGIQYEVPATLYYLHEQSYCLLLLTDNSTSYFTVPENTIYLGVPFIQAYYTIFNLENQTIGFAPNPLPTPTPPGPQPLSTLRLEALATIFTLFVSIIYMIL